MIGCRVVLVRPRIAANIGATARVMHNMGLSQLALVAPAADPLDERARLVATHGEGILTSARVVDQFDEAVADCVLIAGTSARQGGSVRRQSVGSPEAILAHMITAQAQGPVALVLGPERSGLTDAEVTRCHYLIHIPADPLFPSLNLAQAVAICLYELRRLWVQGSAPAAAGEPAATFADQEQLFEHLREGLEAIHFLYGEKADSLMHAIRHLIGRAQPTPMEVGVLHGLARQLDWIGARAKMCEERPRDNTNGP